MLLLDGVVDDVVDPFFFVFYLSGVTTETAQVILMINIVICATKSTVLLSCFGGAKLFEETNRVWLNYLHNKRQTSVYRDNRLRKEIGLFRTSMLFTTFFI